MTYVEGLCLGLRVSDSGLGLIWFQFRVQGSFGLRQGVRRPDNDASVADGRR